MFLLLQASCVFILNTQHDVFLCALLQKQKETNPHDSFLQRLESK